MSHTDRDMRSNGTVTTTASAGPKEPHDLSV